MLIAQKSSSLLDICGHSSKLGSLLAIITQVIHDNSAEKDDIETCLGLAWDLNNDVTNDLSSIIGSPAAANITPPPEPTPVENINLPHASTIGERIRLLRKQRGMTTEELASAINVWNEYVRIIEDGHASPLSDQIIPLSKALNCNPMWLLTGESVAIAEES